MILGFWLMYGLVWFLVVRLGGFNRTAGMVDRTSGFLEMVVAVLIRVGQWMYGLGGLYGFCYVCVHSGALARAIGGNRTALQTEALFRAHPGAVRWARGPPISVVHLGISVVNLEL